METFIFILSSVFLGFLCSAPGIALGYFWSKKGIVRNTPKWVIAQTMIGAFGGRILFPEFPVVFLALLLSIVSPLFYKNELWFTFMRGSWWWLKMNKVDKTKE